MAAIERSRSTHQLQEIESEASTPQSEETLTHDSTIVFEASSPQQEGIDFETSTPGLEETITEDGILGNILSSLSLVEAVRTSVLSPRWRHIWTHLTRFDLTAVSVLNAHTLVGLPLDGEEAYNLTKVHTPAKFIHSVDSIVHQLQGARIHEFTVRYFLNKTHSPHLDAWVRFAVASKTKLLGLHLFTPYSNTLVEPYHFPCHLLQSSQPLERFSLMFSSLKLPRKFEALKYLDRLVLIDVEVSQEDFNRLLSDCSTTITKILVWNIPHLVSISIPHPLSRLQILYVKDCHQLRNIEINAINLCELEYQGLPVHFNFRHSSKLKDADICFETQATHKLEFYLTKLSSSLPCLQSLSFRICGVSQMVGLPKGSNRFIHLKRLVWEWNTDVKMSLLHLATALDVTPLLEELKLCFRERVLEQPPKRPSKYKEMLPKHSSNCLRITQVRGFYFDMWQIEIATYLLNYNPKLESMTIERGSKTSTTVSKKIDERGTQILNQQVPANVKFAIV